MKEVIDLRLLEGRTVVLFSGGLDSSVLAYVIEDADLSPLLLTFDYGQRHVREVARSRVIATRLGVSQREIELSPSVFGDSTLTRGTETPEVGVGQEVLTVAQSIVPNRNVVLLSIAFAVAAADGRDYVSYAAHAVDEPYPDCRPEFIEAFQAMEDAALDEDVVLLAPFLSRSPSDVVRLGADLGVPFEHTWSCYQGQDLHCGRCSACRERREAFVEAGVSDPTVYASGESDEESRRS